MRARIRHLELVGTSRSIDFEPGLNIIRGPISTGKTSLLRLCKICFGAHVKNMPPELNLVPGIMSVMEAGPTHFTLYRPLTDTRRAWISVNTDSTEYALANEAPPFRDRRYSEWLLSAFGLPELRVPSAPTRVESEPSALSVRDFMMYCDLPKDEIRSQVFSHGHPFKDIKRRYIFELVYGIYSAEMANEQSRLRELRHIKANLEYQLRALDAVFAESPWGTAQQIESEIAVLEGKLAKVYEQRKSQADDVARRTGAADLRTKLLKLERELITLEEEERDLRRSLASRSRLVTQLKKQITKLSRAMVARGAFGNISFIRCPACGQELPEEPEVPAYHCRLCRRPSQPAEGSLLEFANEQVRLSRQIDETEDLVTDAQTELERIVVRRSELQHQREALGSDLDRLTAMYMSDMTARLAELAEESALLEERIRNLRKAHSFAAGHGELRKKFESIEREEDSIMATLESLASDRGKAERRIGRLEKEMQRILEQMKLPPFLNVRDVKIARSNYLPIVGGRYFDSLQSEGLTIDVNVAHALAHQIASIKLGLQIPSVLFIDGPSGAFGEKGFDPDRFSALYTQIRRVCDELDGELQVIVADTRIPAGFDDHVRVELTEDNRLIPKKDLEKLWQSRQSLEIE